jgi:diguanylate cyclase (GGDEF)-like protein
MARPVPAPEPGKTAAAPAADPGAGRSGASQADLDRALQAALIESRQRLRELVDLSCDFAWETDSKGRFSFVTGQGVLGRAGADLLGTDPAGLTLAPEDAVHFQSDSPAEGTLVWARTDYGAPVCLHLRARAIFDAEGEFLCVRGACRDVTEAQERDAALAAAKHRERSMLQLFRALREAADPKAAIEQGVATAAQATGAAGAALLAADVHGIGAQLSGAGAAIPASVAERAVRDRQITAETCEGRRLLAIPGEHRGAVNCVLVVARDADQADWPEDDRFLLNELTDQLAVAVAQAVEQDVMARLSETDALTGLLNRRGFDAHLARSMAAARIAKRGGALLYVDLDNFKQINDRHGHAQGDAALRAAAELLRRSVRAGDLVGRLGGDEFAIWLAEVDTREARQRGEQMALTARALQRFAPDSDKPVGFSVGIAMLSADRPQSDAQVMELADKAMYQVKHGTKGGVALLEDER